MICHNCQHVTCPECGHEHAECPKCKPEANIAAADALRSLDLWPGCADGGGHCMLIIGYDEQGVIVMNSWGSDWGERGFARIAWSHILSDKTHMVAVVDEA